MNDNKYVTYEYDNETNIEDAKENAPIKTLKDLLGENDFISDRFDSPIKSQYHCLTDINDYKVTNNNLTEDSVKELKYVEYEMNKLRKQIRNTNFLFSFTNQTCQDMNGVPGGIYGYINKYFNVVGKLITKLEKESIAVISTAVVEKELNEDLSNQLEEMANDTNMSSDNEIGA